MLIILLKLLHKVRSLLDSLVKNVDGWLDLSESLCLSVNNKSLIIKSFKYSRLIEHCRLKYIHIPAVHWHFEINLNALRYSCIGNQLSILYQLYGNCKSEFRIQEIKTVREHQSEKMYWVFHTQSFFTRQKSIIWKTLGYRAFTLSASPHLQTFESIHPSINNQYCKV